MVYIQSDQNINSWVFRIIVVEFEVSLNLKLTTKALGTGASGAKYFLLQSLTNPDRRTNSKNLVRENTRESPSEIVV